MTDVPEDRVTGWWATGISDIAPDIIRMRGYPIEQLIGNASFIDMVWLLLRGELPSRAQSALLEAALVAAVDHGPQAPSIAAARMAATCGVGLNSAVATGVGLLGDVHGGAGQQCMALLAEARERTAAGATTAEAVEELLVELRRDRRYMPGFGHRFHRRDPRRDPLMSAVEKAIADGAADGDFLQIGLEIERRLSEGRDRPVPMNIDGATAIVYSELGFAPELGRGLFVLSRAVGILAHAWEERESGRRIKGPLPPPLLAPYLGPPDRDVPEAR
ncbi:citryl-CoA lyase [Actinomadura sp. LD22]|uniref:citrate synthase (unknown stereospecificity) n=1 Tax=Actinomadura physcomitrii TaxID=2650748 RepID=A0A6I4M793_9ACTN|nr:citryl-CoA lyase [Actinomadura physcomitrii]MWA01643.1 citryl-CoA lyase [Actinomadura physcomitrii]